MKRQLQSDEQKSTWAAPELIEVGHVTEIVRGGGGKLSEATEDSGDAGKPSGLE